MRVDFPYRGYEKIQPVDVPDASLMGVFAPRAMPHVDEEQVLKEGFANPHGTPRLREMVRFADRVLVLIDDGTRGTPVHRILAHVVDELASTGVKDEQIQLLTAQGTHRLMTEDELKQKLGPCFGRFKVHQHEWLKPETLHHFGHTRDGTPVTANRLLTQADFIMGIGSIVPHRVKGFGGGAKIAFPGVAGPEMQYRNQWEASMHMSETVMGEAVNPMRLRMEEAAALVGLRYIVNIVGDIDSRIAGCFCGDPVAAHRAGCRLSREINSAPMPRRADIVLIDAHPADRDVWQSAKGAYAGTMAVRDGGSLIVVAPNPEGIAPNHPNLLEIGYRPHAEIVAMVQRGEVEDLVGVAILADIAQIVDKTDCIMVSPGVKKEDAERIGFRYADSAQQALDMAIEKQGQQASIAVLRHGGHILPQPNEQQMPFP